MTKYFVCSLTYRNLLLFLEECFRDYKIVCFLHKMTTLKNVEGYVFNIFLTGGKVNE